MSSHSSHSDGEESQPEVEEGRQKRKGRFTDSIESRSRKRKRHYPIDPYKKFVGFYTRSQDVYVNYSLVLDAALSLEVKEFGDLTQEQFLHENCKQLKVYHALRKGLPQF